MPPSRLVLWGHSLGTGPAVRMAHEQQLRGEPVRALLLEAPFTTAIDAARTFPTGVVIRSLPWGDYIIRRWFLVQYPNALVLPQLTTPTLVLHGVDDLSVPFAHSVALAGEVARHGIEGCRVRFVPLRRCGHVHICFHPAVLAEVAGFFAGVRKAKADSVSVSETEIEPRVNGS